MKGILASGFFLKCAELMAQVLVDSSSTINYCKNRFVCLFVWYRASISLISGSLPIISCAIMMSLFCCKDTKNIVSRKIVIGRIVFISRGNVRKNNGFPRLMWGCQQDLRCTGYLYIRWKLQRRRRCSMAPTMCSWQICGIRSIWATVVTSGCLFPGKMVLQCWKNDKKHGRSARF